MKFVCFTDWQQLPDSATALFAASAQQSLYLTRPWFETLLETALQQQPALLLASVVEDDQVLAMLPLLKQDSGHWSGLQHGYTPFYSVVLSNQQQQAAIHCLAQGLLSLPLKSLHLEPIADDDPHLNMLQQALESRGGECHRAFRFYNWFHRVQGQSFADYMAQRPARLRNTIARKQRKLAREHGYDIKLYTGDAVQGALADYLAIYNASWKAHEQQVDLIKTLAVRMAQPDWTRLAILYIAGQPAAGQLWFVAHGKASIFRLAYDERWKGYSPGSILTHYLMQQVIDSERVEEIDFLRGNETYKQDWMSERRERWALYCGCVHPQAGNTRPVSSQYCKNLLNKIREFYRLFKRS